ncbi:MAG: hypothetical protein KAW12_29910 [Candidatus Aminicenantes bacterium]|nr:hypothetical protein [Candidatus Aminicenantes bacterium]
MADLKTLNVILNSTGFKFIQNTRINIEGAAYQPLDAPPSFFYFVVVNRSSGIVVKDYCVNCVTPPSNLPEALQEYDKPDYIWLFVSGNMGVTSFPTGGLYDFFVERLGAGEGFGTFLQVVQQGQETGIENFSCALAAVPGEPDKSIESHYAGSNPFHNASLIIQLVPRKTKGGKELLVPSAEAPQRIRVPADDSED